jgi:hypothetical protein
MGCKKEKRKKKKEKLMSGAIAPHFSSLLKALNICKLF